MDGVDFEVEFVGEYFGDFPIERDVAVGEEAKELGEVVCHVDVERRVGVLHVITHRRNRVMPEAELFRENGNIDEQRLRFVPSAGEFVLQIAAEAHLRVHGVLHAHALDVEQELVEVADLQYRRVETRIFRPIGGKDVVVRPIGARILNVKRLRKREFSIGREVFARLGKQKTARHKAGIVGGDDRFARRLDVWWKMNHFSFVGHVWLAFATN